MTSQELFIINTGMEIRKLENLLKDTQSPSARSLLEKIINTKKTKIFPSRMVETFNVNQKETPLHEVHDMEEMEMALGI